MIYTSSVKIYLIPAYTSLQIRLIFHFFILYFYIFHLYIIIIFFNIFSNCIL